MKELDKVSQYLELTKTLRKLETENLKEIAEIERKRKDIVQYKSHFNQPINLPLSYLLEKLQKQYASIKSSVVVKTIYEKNDIITGEDLLESLTEPATVTVDLFDAVDHPIYSFRTKVIPAKLEAKCRVCHSINQEKNLHTFICKTPENIKVDIKIEDIIKDYHKDTTVKYPFERVTLYDVVISYKRHHKESDPETVSQISTLQNDYFHKLERISSLEKSNEYTQKAIKETKETIKAVKKELQPVSIPLSSLILELANLSGDDIDTRLSVLLPWQKETAENKQVASYLATFSKPQKAVVRVLVPKLKKCHYLQTTVAPSSLTYCYHSTEISEDTDGNEKKNFVIRCDYPKDLFVQINPHLLSNEKELYQAVCNYVSTLEDENDDPNRN